MLLKSFGLKRYVEIVPNLITIGALAFGLSSVRAAASGDFYAAVQCLAVSAVLDGLDGHVARALGASTALGAELDSLCDVADFGVAPCFIIYMWGTSSATARTTLTNNDDLALWICCLFYAACCALRLGRFNTKSKRTLEKAMTPNAADRKAIIPLPRNIFKRKLYFSGVPAPMGASLVLTPIAWSMIEIAPLSVDVWKMSHAACAVLLSGALMISTVPTFSSKMLLRDKRSTHLRSRSYARLAFKIFGASTAIYCLVNIPMTAFVAFNVGYLLSVPASWVAFYTLAR